jgi:hypothetical protein
MKKTFPNRLLFIFILFLTFISCNKDDNNPGNVKEQITTMKLTLKETGSGTTKVFEYTDTDGSGGNPPVKFDPIVLSPSRNYTCTIELLNGTGGSALNLTPEIINEAEDHQFFFEPATVNISVINLDSDAKGLPLGITSTWNTGAIGNGTIKITLKHKPDAKFVGDLVANGETDIEVNFTAQIQ